MCGKLSLYSPSPSPSSASPRPPPPLPCAEGVWTVPGNRPSQAKNQQCITKGRLYCNNPGVFNYICSLTKVK